MRRGAGPARAGRPPEATILGRLWDSHGGNSLIEFGFAAPLLTILLLAMMDVAPLTVAKSKLNQATQTSGDVAAATSQMQTSE